MERREMLELAAKAAGLEGEFKVLRSASRDHFKQIRHTSREAFVSKGIVWNPADDDGDAFRLAATLKMSVRFDGRCIYVSSQMAGPANTNCCPRSEGPVDDLLASARRLILLVAAEIGKAMQ